MDTNHHETQGTTTPEVTDDQQTEIERIVDTRGSSYNEAKSEVLGPNVTRITSGSKPEKTPLSVPDQLDIDGHARVVHTDEEQHEINAAGRALANAVKQFVEGQDMRELRKTDRGKFDHEINKFIVRHQKAAASDHLPTAS